MITTYNEHLKPTLGDVELCRLFYLSEEFKYITVRQDKEMELARCLDCVLSPLKETLKSLVPRVMSFYKLIFHSLSLKDYL